MPFPQNEFFLTKKCIAGQRRGITGMRRLPGDFGQQFRLSYFPPRTHRTYKAYKTYKVRGVRRNVFSENSLKKKETGLH